MTRDPHRPAYHFTTPSGWINDPLGVTWHETSDGGRYELFFQFNPSGSAWVPECRWGQAHGPDLVRWQQPRTALEPETGQGCWSGAVVVDDDGRPTILYTSMRVDTLGVGGVTLAHGDHRWDRWTVDAAGPVVDGPPPELGMRHFRDPFVWRAQEGWRMAVGGGLRDGRAAVLQYSSPDLRTWRVDGLLVERSVEEGEPLWTGSVWECPQLFHLDGAWVLVVSVWHEETLNGVACAVGHYDGQRFTARAWQRLSAGDALYATTTFLDSAGRRCALGWVRGTGPDGGPWAGALSVPHLLERAGDRIGVRPHPDVDSLRTGVLFALREVFLGSDPVVLGPMTPTVDVLLSGVLQSGGRLRLALHDGDREPLAVVLDAAADVARLLRPGHQDETAPLGIAPDGAVGLRLLLDAGIAELFTGTGTAPGAVGVVTVPPADAVRMELSGEGARLTGVTVHGMARCCD